MNTNICYDILIIGAGPAGMTAAIYAGRSNKQVALIDKNGFGGNIANSPKVENIPGFVSISGADFAANMYEQISNFSTVNHIIAEALFIDYRYGLFRITLDDKSIICGKTLIFATGTEHRQLKLDTKDIYYCATCDGPFFKNKNVIVVGSGNTGATYALELSTYCKNVYLCDLTHEMQCEPILQDQILAQSNIYWLPNTTIKDVKNGKNNNLSSVILTTNEVLKCNAIFAAIGIIPQTKIVGPFADVTWDDYIISNDGISTKVPGVFIAGDCRDTKVKQVVTAVSDGAKAAVNAMTFLKGLK